MLFPQSGFLKSRTIESMFALNRPWHNVVWYVVLLYTDWRVSSFNDCLSCLRPDFTSKLVRELAFGTPKFYTAPYDKIILMHELVNLSCNCDVKSKLVRELAFGTCDQINHRLVNMN